VLEAKDNTDGHNHDCQTDGNTYRRYTNSGTAYALVPLLSSIGIGIRLFTVDSSR
jgi:hypothetical protein